MLHRNSEQYQNQYTLSSLHLLPWPQYFAPFVIENDYSCPASSALHKTSPRVFLFSVVWLLPTHACPPTHTQNYPRKHSLSHVVCIVRFTHSLLCISFISFPSSPSPALSVRPVSLYAQDCEWPFSFRPPMGVAKKSRASFVNLWTCDAALSVVTEYGE